MNLKSTNPGAIEPRLRPQVFSALEFLYTQHVLVEKSDMQYNELASWVPFLFLSPKFYFSALEI